MSDSGGRGMPRRDACKVINSVNSGECKAFNYVVSGAHKVINSSVSGAHKVINFVNSGITPPLGSQNVAWERKEEGKVFLEEEIKNLVWSCDCLKSPGSDDFNFGFLKFSWDIIKKDIILAENEFSKYGKWPRGTNSSFIYLVPKSDNPQ